MFNESEIVIAAGYSEPWFYVKQEKEDGGSDELSKLECFGVVCQVATSPKYIVVYHRVNRACEGVESFYGTSDKLEDALKTLHDTVKKAAPEIAKEKGLPLVDRLEEEMWAAGVWIE